MATINKGDAKKVQANIAATVYIMVMAKKRAKKKPNANVATIANKPIKKRINGNIRKKNANVLATTNKTATAYTNVTTNNTKAGANVLVIVNADKGTSNIRKYMSTYWQL